MTQVIRDVCTAEKKKVSGRLNPTITSLSPTPTAVLDDGDLSPRSVYQIHMPLSATSESSASRSHRHKAALNPAALT